MTRGADIIGEGRIGRGYSSGVSNTYIKLKRECECGKKINAREGARGISIKRRANGESTQVDVCKTEGE